LAAPSRSDLRLFRQAINGGYNLTPEMRAEIVAVAREILNSPPSIGKDGAVSNRDQIAAAKVLLAADKMDLDALKVAVDESKQPGASSITNNTQINISTQPVPRALQNKEGRDALAKLAELAFDGDAAEPSEG